MNKEHKLPKNATQLILPYIARVGPQTQKDLHKEFSITLRALRYALDKCEKQGCLVKRPNLADIRSPYYSLTISSNELDLFMENPLSMPSQQEVAISA